MISNRKEYFDIILHKDLYSKMKIAVSKSISFLKKKLNENSTNIYVYKDYYPVFKSNGDIDGLILEDKKNYMNFISSNFDDILKINSVNEVISLIEKYNSKYDTGKDLFYRFLYSISSLKFFPNYDRNEFNEVYYHLEYLLHSNENNFFIVPLFSVNINNNSNIKLKNDYIIRRVKPYEYTNLRKYGIYVLLDKKILQKSNYLLEFNCKDGDYQNKFDDFVNALHLFKKGNFDYNMIVGGHCVEDNLLMRYGSGIGFNKPNLNINSQFIFEPTDIKLFKEFFTEWLKVSNTIKENLSFSNAIKRFTKAIEDRELNDKIIDFIISLESLLGDGNTELIHRLSMRTGFLLGTKKESKDIRDFIKKIYDTRSKIVHGDKERTINMNGIEFTKEKSVVVLEDIIRLVFQRYLDFALSIFYVEHSSFYKSIDSWMLMGDKSQLNKIPKNFYYVKKNLFSS